MFGSSRKRGASSAFWEVWHRIGARIFQNCTVSTVTVAPAVLFEKCGTGLVLRSFKTAQLAQLQLSSRSKEKRICHLANGWKLKTIGPKNQNVATQIPIPKHIAKYVVRAPAITYSHLYCFSFSPHTVFHERFFWTPFVSGQGSRKGQCLTWNQCVLRKACSASYMHWNT